MTKARLGDFTSSEFRSESSKSSPPFLNLGLDAMRPGKVCHGIC